MEHNLGPTQVKLLTELVRLHRAGLRATGVRYYCNTFGLSITTIRQTFHNLYKRGLLATSGRKGYRPINSYRPTKAGLKLIAGLGG